MTYHDEYLKLISAGLDGALSPDDRAKLDTHLAQCPDCKALYDQLWVTAKAVKGLSPVEPPAELVDRIMAAVEEDKVVPLPAPAKRKQPWRKWLAAAASLALILMGGYSVMRVMGDPVYSRAPESAPAQGASGAMNTVEEKAESDPDEITYETVTFDPAEYAADPTGDSGEMLTKAFTVPAPESGQAIGWPLETSETADDKRSALPDPGAAESTTEDAPGVTEATEEEPDATVRLSLQEGPTNEAVEEGEAESAMVTSFAVTVQTVTPQAALELVAERVYGDSGYEQVIEYAADGYSCLVRLTDNGDTVPGTEGSIGYVELSPNGRYYLFSWTWEGQTEEEDALYRYAVPLDGSYVMWAGDVADGGETFWKTVNE